MSVSDVETNYDPKSVAKLWQEVSRGSPRTVEGFHRRKDGITFPVEVRLGLFESEGESLLVASVRDITERRRTEEQRREAETRYRTLFEQIPAITYVEALDYGERATNLLYVSPQIEAIFGYSAEEWMSDPELFSKLLHPEDRERVLQQDALTDATGEPFKTEYRQDTKDGQLIWLRDEAVLVRDEEGHPMFWQGVVTDITDRKRSEEEIQESEQRFQATFEQAAVGVAHDVTERKRAEEVLEEVREAERNRIARDLHDDILQNIVYALQEAQILQAISEDGGNNELENIAEALRQSVEGLRSAIFELHLTGALSQSFMVSLQALLETNRRMSRNQYSLALSVGSEFPENIHEAKGRQIIRIVQEALNNVRRHADVHHVFVELGQENGLVWVEVVDDGKGFDAEAIFGGVGQNSMRQRAEEIGGDLIVESSPGVGAKVRLEIPVSRLIHE